MAIDPKNSLPDTEQTDYQTLLQNIFALDLRQCNLTVYLAALRPQVEDKPRFRLINLSTGAGEEFYKSIDEALKPFKEGSVNGHVTIHAFEADTVQPENEIEYLDISKYQAITDQLTALVQPAGLPSFDYGDKEFRAALRFYVLQVEPLKGPTVYCYRKYDDSKLLTESTQFGMHLLHTNYYDKVTDPTLLFDRKLDCISCGKHMYVLNKSNFYTIFSFTDLLKEVALRTLDELRIKDFVHNFDRFSRDCMKNNIKILMLKNISMKSYLQTITIDDLERTIKAYEKDLPIRVEKVNGKKKLFYNHSRPWDILKLLDDKYVESLMTNASYEAKGKRALRKK